MHQPLYMIRVSLSQNNYLTELLLVSDVKTQTLSLTEQDIQKTIFVMSQLLW